MKYRFELIGILICAGLVFPGCSIAKKTYRIGKGAVTGTLWVVKGAYKFTRKTTKLVYKIGKFSFEVTKAPLDWPLMNDEIESIDGLPVKEAIRQGRVKNSPYTVKGKRYHPMTVAKARGYDEKGIASWYGNETLRQKDGHMTANGEAFNPKALSAAHKLLPLPTNVKVTSLENGRSVIVRVNDRGPFPSIHNARSGDRVIDLSAAAAKKLGFYRKGTARVRVQAVELVETG